MVSKLELKQLFKLNKTKEIAIATLIGLAWVILFLVYLNFFQSSALFFLIFLVCLAFIIFRVPEAGIHITIISVMVFERWFSLEPLNIFSIAVKIYPLDVILVLIALAVFLNAKFKAHVFKEKDIVPILVFFGAVVFWSVFSFFKGGDPSLIGSVLKNTIFYSILFFTIVTHCRSKEEWVRIFSSVLAGGLVIIGFIIYGIMAGEGLWSAYTPLSTAGSRLLAATHAFFIILPLYLLISLYAFKIKILGKADFAVLLLWMLGLIFSLFRNLWIGFIIGIVIVLLFLEKKQIREFVVLFLKILALAIVFAVVLVWLFYLVTADTSMIDDFTYAITERTSALNPFAVYDESARFRLAAWEESWKQFTSNPLLGIGFGQEIEFELSGNEYKIEVRELHNDYVAFVLQMGILGFAAFAYFIVAMIIRGINSVRRSDIGLKPYLIAAFAFFCTFLALSAMGTYWETNFFLVFFWLALGLMISANNFKQE